MIWNIDTMHSTANFKVRHLGISNVRGSFSGLTGTIETDDAGKIQKVKASIPVGTVNTDNADRDNHLKAKDFFNVEEFPTMEFESTGVEPSSDGYAIHGNLTIHGVTRPVVFNTEVSAPVKDPMSGMQKMGGETSFDISRKDYGLTWNVAIEAGGVMLGDKVSVTLELQAVQQA